MHGKKNATWRAGGQGGREEKYLHSSVEGGQGLARIATLDAASFKLNSPIRNGSRILNPTCVLPCLACRLSPAQRPRDSKPASEASKHERDRLRLRLGPRLRLAAFAIGQFGNVEARCVSKMKMVRRVRVLENGIGSEGGRPDQIETGRDNSICIVAGSVASCGDEYYRYLHIYICLVELSCGSDKMDSRCT